MRSYRKKRGKGKYWFPPAVVAEKAVGAMDNFIGDKDEEDVF